MNIKKIKKKLPYPIKQSAKYLYGAIPPRFRYGKTFWDTYNFLQESQWWSRKKLEEYQMQQLEKLLKYAYVNVPYYRKNFDERGLKARNIQNFNYYRALWVYGDALKGWEASLQDKGHMEELRTFAMFLRKLSETPIPLKSLTETAKVCFVSARGIKWE